MAVTLTARNGLVSLRRIAVDGIAPGEHRDIDVDIVANAAHDEVRLAATVSGWLEVSVNGGMTWLPLGTDVMTGVDIGPMFAGQRRQVKVRVAPPVAFRQRRIGLLVGGGT